MFLHAGLALSGEFLFTVVQLPYVDRMATLKCKLFSATRSDRVPHPSPRHRRLSQNLQRQKEIKSKLRQSFLFEAVTFFELFATRLYKHIVNCNKNAKSTIPKSEPSQLTSSLLTGSIGVSLFLLMLRRTHFYFMQVVSFSIHVWNVTYNTSDYQPVVSKFDC